MHGLPLLLLVLVVPLRPPMQQPVPGGLLRLRPSHLLFFVLPVSLWHGRQGLPLL